MSKKIKFNAPANPQPTIYSAPTMVAGQRCYHTHPALKLPGTEFVIYGGSCITPTHKDADIYIGFDRGMELQPNLFPWEGKAQILHPITDMRAPSDLEAFKKVLAFVKQQLAAGKKVHCGCIGGHGRTGTFFAALVASYGEKDAIKYVRENYCKKAVESTEQIKWLGEHFGVLPAEPSKGHGGTQSTGQGVQSGFGFHKEVPHGSGKKNGGGTTHLSNGPAVFSGGNGNKLTTFDPIVSPGSIWKRA